ncbi:toluene efflux pump outer membrane protein TtgI precursor [bacterium BMS3Bbin09]|nr:toluene efflux pump outer membrane protein TtgI precursor [bacterium BMS3Bbin09]
MKILLKRASILIVLLIFSGCSVHSPLIKGQEVDLPDSYSSEKPVSSPPVGRWWEWLGDEKLNALMEEALQNNLDIAQAYERLQQSLAIVRTTNSARGPVLNIEGSGGRARKSGVTAETYTLSAATSFEIDLWNKLGSRTRAARLDALASEEDLRSLYISISAQVADLYFLAIEHRAQIELSDNTIKSYRDTLKKVESRYRHGLVPAIDLYQSRQNLSSARAQLPVFEQNLATTLNALSVLTGRFPDNEIGGNANELIDTPEFPAGIPSELLTKRPDIRSAWLRLNAADERIGAAIANRFPSFNLVGTYGGASTKVRNILDSPNILWNILLQAVQPVIDSGRRSAEVERTRAVFREKLAAYHKTVLNAFKEVEDSLIKNRSSEKRISMLKENMAASENSLRIALDRYIQGLTDYLPVLTGQLHNFTAKSRLLAAKRQLISDRIELARALGGEWTDEIMKEYLTDKKGSTYEH